MIDIILSSLNPETVMDFLLILLCFFCSADQDIVKSNIDVLVKEGLGPRAEEDFLLARDTCSVLLKMSHLNKVIFPIFINDVLFKGLYFFNVTCVRYFAFNYIIVYVKLFTVFDNFLLL